MASTRSCMTCGHAPPFPLYFEPRGSPFRLVRCPGCGLVFQDPQPSDEVLAASYYHDPGFTRLLFGPLREYTVKRAREKRALLEREGALWPGQRLLDVGCSSGAWLELAQRGGARGRGVEIGAVTAELARRRGLDVRTGTLEECFGEGASERFDLITFWDVLEHLRDPLATLQAAARLLSAGGMVAATFPNVEGLYPQVTLRLLGRPAGVWEYPELPVHLYDFSPATARRLCDRAGLHVRRIRTLPTPFVVYRSGALSRERLGGGRGIAIRALFECLRVPLYPLARRLDRQNSLFVLAARS